MEPQLQYIHTLAKQYKIYFEHPDSLYRDLNKLDKSVIQDVVRESGKTCMPSK